MSGKWFSIKLVFGELVETCLCQGILVFSASPIQRIRCGIEFFDKKTIPEDTAIENYIQTYKQIYEQMNGLSSLDLECIKNYPVAFIM